MINNIISFSIKNKLIIGLMVLALTGTGIWAMITVNLGSVPDITNNQVQIITVSQNLSTEDVEQFVTYPVELAMANLPGVNEIRSVSRFGLSVVTIVFEDQMGTYLPRQLIQEKLNEIREEIPEQFGSPSMGPISTGLGEIYQYTLKPQPGYDSVYSPIALRTIQDWIVSRQMALVPGVVEVNAFGGKIKQYEIALDPGKLNSMNISIAEVFEALEKNNVNTGGAYIEKNSMANFIRGEGLAKSLEDIRNIVVKTVEGTPILVKNVAEKVHFGSQVRYGAFTQDGQEAVGGMVLMLRGANPNAVIQHVKDRMEEVQKSLPEGLEIAPFLDRSDLIARTTSTVTKNLTEGALIVVFVLVILLGSFRGGLITASVIPLALLFAFICMRIFNVWANLMSLGAIDFGIIVDGAVIIVEGTVHLIEKRIKEGRHTFHRGQMDEITYEASSTMMNSAFFGQVIILIVFAPILFLTGVEGKMFQPMAYTFGFAVLGAIMLCLTYVPMITSIVLKPATGKKNLFHKFEDTVQQGSDWLMDKIYKGYHPIIRRSLHNKAVILIIALLLLVGAGFTFSRMGGEFIPNLDEGDIAMQALLRPGTSLSESIAQSKKVENIVLDNFPEVKTMVARIGVSAIPTDPMPMDIADTYIILEKDMDKWVNAATKEELIEKIKEKLSVLPGVNYVFSQPVELRFNELITGVREDVAVKLYGEDLDVLASKAEQMAQIIKTVPGAGDVNLEATAGLPQMTVRFKRGKIAQYGLDIEKLNRYISSAFAGGKAGVIFEGEKRFDMVIRLAEENRRSIDNLKNLYIDLPNREQIPMQEVATISYQPGPMQISRDNTFRRIYVGVNVRGRDVESVVNEIQQKLDEQLKLPPGYYITYGGSFENLQRAKRRLQVVVPIALALIFILLYFALQSFSQAIMIYMAVPLAAIGGVFALAIRGMPFSISAGVGFIVLFGVAVLNGLVLISRFNSLTMEGITDLRQRIFIGTEERIRPILLTATAAIMGFIPMAVSASAGAEVQRPLATVVIGGLISATLLTLIVVPVLYYLVEVRLHKHKKENSKARASLATSVVIFAGLGMGTLMFPNQAKAQQTQTASGSPPRMSLDEALREALANYPSIKKAALGIAREEALRKTVLDLGNTQLYTGGEELKGSAGSDNSAGGIHTTIGIQQQQIDLLSAPAKGKYQKEKIRSAERMRDLTGQELICNVKQAYYQAVTEKKRVVLAQRLDSIYADFEKAAELRYEVEATSRLELLAAQSQYQQIQVMKQQATHDYQKALEGLRQWVMTDKPLEVVSNVPVEPLSLAAGDSAWMEANPILDVYQQQVEVNQAATRVEKAGLLPKLNLQYGMQQVSGVSGFYTYQAGISIPLWFRPQQGRIQAAQLDTRIAQQEYERQKITLKATLDQLWQDYQKYLSAITYYQEEALPLSDEQITAAELSYREGAIDYVNYIQNLNTAITVQQQYLDFYNQYLQVKTQIEFITGQSH